MFERVHVIGAPAASAPRWRPPRRARRRVDGGQPELVLLCVPDRAIAEVAAAIEPGAVGRARQRRDAARRARPAHAPLRLHPLQTFTRARGPEQLDGALAAVTAETDEARDASASGSRETLGLRPFALDDDARAALPRGRRDRVELPRHPAPRRRLAARGRRRAARGARPADAAHDRERLRADRADRARRLGDRRARTSQAIRARARPSSSRCTRARRGDEARSREDGVARSPSVAGRSRLRDALGRARRPIGLVPTMGALHDGHLVAARAPRARSARPSW